MHTAITASYPTHSFITAEGPFSYIPPAQFMTRVMVTITVILIVKVRVRIIIIIIISGIQ